MSDLELQMKEQHTIFETSPNQKSIYAINQLDPSSTNYNITQAIIVNQRLDKERLHEKAKMVVNRYEALRASFFMEDGELFQQIQEEIDFDFSFHQVESEHKIDLLLNNFVKGFDLSIPRLLRFLLVKVTEERYYFVIDIHHIIADGISVVMIMHEILDENNDIPHVPGKYQQSDVIALKRKELEEKGDIYRDYWESRFQEAIPMIDLPFDRGVNDIKTNAAGRMYFDISKELMMKLKNLSRNNKVTLFNLLLTTFYVLLYKVTGQNDIVIGIPVSGRTISASRKAVGMFVNTVPFRMNYMDEEKFNDLLNAVSEEFSLVMKYQDYPMDDLIDSLNLKREVNRNFLFDVMFSYYSKKFGSKFSNVDKYTYKNSDAQFFLTMNAEEGNDGISIELEYYKDLFDDVTIARFGERYETLLNCIAEEAGEKISEIDYLPGTEKNILNRVFNNTEVPFDYDLKVYQMIEKNAYDFPDKTAVIFDDKEVSYKEINEKANKIAHMLNERGVEEGSCAGLFLERSDLFMEAVLGVWKAGLGYIPMDTGYPIERIAHIISASKMKYIITSSKYVRPELKERLGDAEIICLDLIELDKYDSQNSEKAYSCHNTAYIIFTSGSTGKPKGAMIEQVGMTNHMLAKKHDLRLNENSVLVQNASQCFDISVWQLFNALIAGGTTLILSNDKILDINTFLYYMDHNNVTVLEVVPSYLAIMLEKLKEGTHLKSLEYLVVTGEKIGSDIVKRWFETGLNIKMVNAYGPTEASDDITHYIMSDYPGLINIPIGKPIQNMKIHIVDKHEKLCGIGVKGEIYVSGIGVGRGYIGEKKKTQEAFITNASITSERLYKTGDVGRWLADGNIEYLERKDYQVKIRGYRIELGEIEAKLLENPNIHQAVVLDKTNDKNDKFLCAYIVTSQKLESEGIKKELSMNLPYYMIPDHILIIDSIPITANGKTDREKLLNIPIKVKEKIQRKPKTWTQKKLALIWCEILSIESVGVDDKFFELFGHSLKAIQMADLINNEFHVQLTVEDIFRNDTILKQEMLIASSNKTEKKSVPKAENQNEFVISPAQKRIYSICQSTDAEIAYNMPGLFEIDGNLDKDKAQLIFGRLLQRHAGLRSSFMVSGKDIIQKIRQTIDFEVTEIFKDEFDAKSILLEYVRPFDLERDVLLRVAIISIKDGKRYLFFDMHHIVSDGVSMEIIVKEFIKIYQGDKLPKLQYEYADYVHWQKKRKDDLRNQEQYWLGRFSDGIPQLDMVTDFQRPQLPSYAGKNQIMVIEGEDYKKIKALALRMNCTLHMVLMAIFKILLSKYTGKSDLVVGTVSAGRKEPAFKDIVGMFVNTLPIRTKQNQNTSFQYFVKEVKKKMLEALDNDEYQFDDMVKNLNLKRDISRNPLFDILFVMQDDYVGEINARELSLKSIDYPKETSKFDIEFQAFENQNQLILDMCYKTCLFKEETIAAMLQRYKYILKQVADDPHMLLSGIKISSEADMRVMHTFNSTEGDYDTGLSLVDLFEEKVFLNPYNKALIMDDKFMTYHELDNRANQLAGMFLEEGIESGDRIAIIMDDCFEMMVSILAILKAGAVYVPIDMNFPQNRIHMMLTDSKAKLLLYTDEDSCVSANIVKQMNVRTCGLDNAEVKDLCIQVNGDDAACIVYTSGTTGKPKGNLVLHKNIIRVVYHTNYVEFDKDDCVLQAAHYGFDGSFFNIFGALLNGASLVLCSRKNLLDLDYISGLIRDKGVSIFFATTSLFNAWVDSIGKSLSGVRCIVFGGEKASEKHCRKALGYLKKGILINGYGPTESTVFTTAYIMKSQSDIMENIPIGKVITNTSVYILGINDQINPVGIPGELCIAGQGLVNGYTNAEDLMKKKFVLNPHNKKEILYRTGDLALWKDNGNIQFLGRIDNQVKVNGYRIELEEIEIVLSRHELVKDVAVIMKEAAEGMKIIVAFYTCEGELSGNEMKDWMKQIVPQYMIPKYFVKLECMPLNQNGKINRSKLTDLEVLSSSKKVLECDENLNFIQKSLLEASRMILGIEELTLQDDFYEMGGDSIKAIQLAAALKKYHLNVSTKDILLNPVLSELSDLIDFSGETAAHEKVVGEVRLLPVYRFFVERNRDLNYFNQSVMLYTKEKINADILAEIFKVLVHDHDMLRAVYRNNKLMCRDVDENGLFEILEYDYRDMDLSEAEISKKIYDIKSSADIETGPAMKAALFKREDGTHLLISIHHFVVDTVSWRILLDDITASYALLKQDKQLMPLNVTNSFKDWVDHIYQYAESKSFSDEQEYWKEKDGKNHWMIPTMKKVSDDCQGRQTKVSASLSEHATEDLLYQTNKAYNTEVRHLLIAALGLAVQKTFSVEGPLRILMEGHGRESIFNDMDVSRTVGWFTTLFPLLLELDHLSVSDTIKMVKDTIKRIPNNGIGYGIYKYLSSEKTSLRGFSQEDISFNYLGAFDNIGESQQFSLSSIPNEFDQGDHISMTAKMEITAGIYAGRMKLDITYNDQDLSVDIVHKLMQNYVQIINEVTEHCVRKEDTERTLSDFEDKDLNNDELQSIAELFS